MHNLKIETGKDCAYDLLLRMMLAAKNQDCVDKRMIERNASKFQSAVVIQSMINGNHIVGCTNQEVYKMYVYVSKEMNLPILSQIDFSRTLCKYYGFELKSKRINGRVARIYEIKNPIVTSDAKSISCAVHYINNVLKLDDVIASRNSKVHDQYVKWCRENIQPACSKVEFSRLICSALQLNMKSIKEDGKTIRIYMREVTSDYGDNTSNQKNPG